MGFPATLLAIALAASTAPAPLETFPEVQGPNGALKGTMLSPAKSAPIVLMIPGSGPTDRDGNNSAGLKAGTLRLLAEGLAARGIATVRIDKRGMYASAGAIADANAVTMEDYASDTHSWITSIQRSTGAKCVWLLGHSEGGTVALLAGQDDEKICGVILISTPGRPLGQVLDEQLKANPANSPILDEAEGIISELEAGHRVDKASINPVLLPLFHPAVQGFLISQFAIDPAKLAAKCSKPVLILQGERDIQVSRRDAQLLKDAQPKAKLVLLPATNHVLKEIASDDRRANIATYSDPGLPLAPGVANAIADFIKAPPR
ncbi:lysophospholipase [Sphingobium yanoikuyae]|uniref:Lysophospholipase n=2 Tax=Sphingobium TaxID=165695 RepID=A0AA42WXK1_SPHYA|nr:MULTISPECIES: alpha/beta fold hydrolase [Sphingobium]MBB4148070.1 hypothetical protein [Sphingobium scionense]MDH2133629.1 lysophospholipase [Sphingobium yanoikuyae]MDH2151551.1 lysophospholipase [Sphingobium yanoikuyae]MDH2168944.1 lysophospholipase [Sphingobium yanoikuyae]